MDNGTTRMLNDNSACCVVNVDFVDVLFMPSRLPTVDCRSPDGIKSVQFPTGELGIK